MNNSFYRQTVFTQKIICTEVLRTEGFTHNSFYIHAFLHTGVFTQTQIAHRNLCTQHAFTHCQLLHREALFPLLDHLPFVFPPSGGYSHMNDMFISKYGATIWSFFNVKSTGLPAPLLFGGEDKAFL